jgi:hypothetical protein
MIILFLMRYNYYYNNNKYTWIKSYVLYSNLTTVHRPWSVFSYKSQLIDFNCRFVHSNC